MEFLYSLPSNITLTVVLTNPYRIVGATEPATEHELAGARLAGAEWRCRCSVHRACIGRTVVALCAERCAIARVNRAAGL